MKNKLCKRDLTNTKLSKDKRGGLLARKEEAILFLTQSLCLIVNGMDQNTTMVSKLRQLVKGIESRYVKTHLCGVQV